MYYKILIKEKWVPKGFVGITIYPVIIFKSKNSLENKVLVNHEKIHIKQQVELLFVVFFIWYGIEFLIRWRQLKDRKRAYRAISFEREAYQHEANLDYLRTRKFGAFRKYI